MADDWIKVRTNLRRHPKVVRIASELQCDKLRVLGGLMAVWSVFDEHTTDGFLPAYTFTSMDEEIAWPGFSKAMAGVGWLTEDERGGLNMREFSTHNGQSAKRRANDAVRKRQERAESDPRPQKVRKRSKKPPDGTRTRGEENIPSSPAEKKGARASRRAAKCDMPAEFTQRYVETDPGIVGWAEASGVEVATLGLHYEYFKLAVEKSALRYAGMNGWAAAFKTAVRNDWAGLRQGGGRKGRAPGAWLDELTGRGGDNGRVIEGSSTTESSR